LCFGVLTTGALADTGVLEPFDGSEYLDASLLTLEDMELRIRIDHGWPASRCCKSTKVAARWCLKAITG
jgi:hypothetical protein